MRRPSAREGSPGRVGEWLFAGLVAALLCLDSLLLVWPPDGSAGLLRLLLAVGAVATVPLGVILGIVYGPGYAVGSLLALPVVVVYAVTGLLLPWNQLAFYTGQQVLAVLLDVPMLGERLATVFLGGHVLSQRSLRLAFRYHYAVVGIGFLGLVAALGAGAFGRFTTSDPARE